MRIILIYMLIFGVFDDVNLIQPKAPVAFGKCRIVFNEINLGRPQDEFIEIGKVCEKNAENNFLSLNGYYLVGITLAREKTLSLSVDLASDHLFSENGFDYYVIGGENVENNKKNFSLTHYVSSRPLKQALPSWYEDFGYTYVLILLHFKSKTHNLRSKKSSLKLKFNHENKEFQNKTLDEDIYKLFSDHIQDAILLAEPCDVTDSCEIIKKFWKSDEDPNLVPRLTPSSQDPHVESLNRCTNESSDPFMSSSFLYNTLTPGKINICTNDNTISDVTSKGSVQFSLQGKLLRRQTKQIIFNIASFFEKIKSEDEEDMSIFNENTAFIVGKAVNINTKLVRKIISEYTETGNFQSTPKRKIWGCKKINKLLSEDFPKLKSIIIDFYKRNQPPFLKEIYAKFLLYKKSQLKSKNVRQLFASESSESSIAQQIDSHDAEIRNKVFNKKVIHISESEKRRLLPIGATDMSFVRDIRNDSYASTLPEDLEEYKLSFMTFKKFVRKSGFIYGNINTRKAIIQRPDIVNKRSIYLRMMKLNRESNNPLPIIYMDETWVDANARFKKGWIPKKFTSGSMYTQFSYSKHNIGRAPRIIVIGAASSDKGVIKELFKVYTVKKKDVMHDYHENINSEVFLQWTQELIEYLKNKGPHIVVLDNAPYHSKSDAPKSSSTKKTMYDWLQEEAKTDHTIKLGNITEMRRDALWNLVKSKKSNSGYYTIDKILETSGHKVVRLPPYNCDLNPIEFLWADLKRTISIQNTVERIHETVNLTTKLLAEYPFEKWNKTYHHIIKIENTYWSEDNLMENVRSDFNIVIHDDFDEDENSDEEDEEYDDDECDDEEAVNDLEYSFETLYADDPENIEFFAHLNGESPSRGVKRKIDASIDS